MANVLSALKVLLPKRSNPKGISTTPTFDASNSQKVLTAPTYRDHLSDIFSNRTSLDSRALLQQLFKTDPDTSASVNAYLTVANTAPILIVKDVNDQIDLAGQEILNQILMAFTTRVDYTKGFKIVPSLRSLTEEFRYMLLLRGGIGAELVVSKEFLPAEIRQVDLGPVEWFEKSPGQYTPQQTTKDGKAISLDIPTFFATWFRKDPTSIYASSPFVSAINTIASRQQVINDLYRIMRLTGYPRMEVEILEDVVLKNAPASVKADPKAQQAYLAEQLRSITNTINGIGPEQTFVHFDSVKPGMMNEKSAATTLNIDSVMNALNAQNQAGLRTMATILGRGEAGVNTATVEARIFAMIAEELNKPIADLLGQILTMAVRLRGSQSYVHVDFQPVELRSATELETNLLIRAQRLKADLSLGIITDEEYALMMYGRLPPKGAPKLSGTNFDGVGAAAVDVTAITPNQDPLGKTLSPKEGTAPARSNAMGKSKVQSG